VDTDALSSRCCHPRCSCCTTKLAACTSWCGFSWWWWLWLSRTCSSLARSRERTSCCSWGPASVSARGCGKGDGSEATATRRATWLASGFACLPPTLPHLLARGSLTSTAGGQPHSLPLLTAPTLEAFFCLLTSARACGVASAVVASRLLVVVLLQWLRWLLQWLRVMLLLLCYGCCRCHFCSSCWRRYVQVRGQRSGVALPAAGRGVWHSRGAGSAVKRRTRGVLAGLAAPDDSGRRGGLPLGYTCRLGLQHPQLGYVAAGAPVAVVCAAAAAALVVAAAKSPFDMFAGLAYAHSTHTTRQASQWC
jgi:hypothetical protein